MWKNCKSDVFESSLISILFLHIHHIGMSNAVLEIIKIIKDNCFDANYDLLIKNI